MHQEYTDIMVKVRKTFPFSVEQTPAGANYVPKQSRDPQFASRFEGLRGSRMAWQEHVGATAVALLFEDVMAHGTTEDVDSTANFIGLVTMGSAFHHYVEGASDVSSRRVWLPLVMDPETGQRMSTDELLARTDTALDDAMDLTFEQEQAAMEQTPFRNRERLGAHLATTSLMLAAIEHHVTDLRVDPVRTQLAVWNAAHALQSDLVNFTHKVGYRPTLAQIGDDYSPLSKHMRDDLSFLTQKAYRRLNDAIEFAASN